MLRENGWREYIYSEDVILAGGDGAIQSIKGGETAGGSKDQQYGKSNAVAAGSKIGRKSESGEYGEGKAGDDSDGRKSGKGGAGKTGDYAKVGAANKGKTGDGGDGKGKGGYSKGKAGTGSALGKACPEKTECGFETPSGRSKTGKGKRSRPGEEEYAEYVDDAGKIQKKPVEYEEYIDENGMKRRRRKQKKCFECHEDLEEYIDETGQKRKKNNSGIPVAVRNKYAKDEEFLGCPDDISCRNENCEHRDRSGNQGRPKTSPTPKVNLCESLSNRPSTAETPQASKRNQLESHPVRSKSPSLKAAETLSDRSRQIPLKTTQQIPLSQKPCKPIECSIEMKPVQSIYKSDTQNDSSYNVPSKGPSTPCANAETSIASSIVTSESNTQNSSKKYTMLRSNINGEVFEIQMRDCPAKVDDNSGPRNVRQTQTASKNVNNDVKMYTSPVPNRPNKNPISKIYGSEKELCSERYDCRQDSFNTNKTQAPNKNMYSARIETLNHTVTKNNVRTPGDKFFPELETTRIKQTCAGNQTQASVRAKWDQIKGCSCDVKIGSQPGNLHPFLGLEYKDNDQRPSIRNQSCQYENATSTPRKTELQKCEKCNCHRRLTSGYAKLKKMEPKKKEISKGVGTENKYKNCRQSYCNTSSSILSSSSVKKICINKMTSYFENNERYDELQKAFSSDEIYSDEIRSRNCTCCFCPQDIRTSSSIFNERYNGNYRLSSGGGKSVCGSDILKYDILRTIASCSYFINSSSSSNNIRESKHSLENSYNMKPKCKCRTPLHIETIKNKIKQKIIEGDVLRLRSGESRTDNKIGNKNNRQNEQDSAKEKKSFWKKSIKLNKKNPRISKTNVKLSSENVVKTKIKKSSLRSSNVFSYGLMDTKKAKTRISFKGDEVDNKVEKKDSELSKCEGCLGSYTSHSYFINKDVKVTKIKDVSTNSQPDLFDSKLISKKGFKIEIPKICAICSKKKEYGFICYDDCFVSKQKSEEIDTVKSQKKSETTSCTSEKSIQCENSIEKFRSEPITLCSADSMDTMDVYSKIEQNINSNTRSKEIGLRLRCGVSMSQSKLSLSNGQNIKLSTSSCFCSLERSRFMKGHNKLLVKKIQPRCVRAPKHAAAVLECNQNKFENKKRFRNRSISRTSLLSQDLLKNKSCKKINDLVEQIPQKKSFTINTFIPQLKNRKQLFENRANNNLEKYAETWSIENYEKSINSDESSLKSRAQISINDELLQEARIISEMLVKPQKYNYNKMFKTRKNSTFDLDNQSLEDLKLSFDDSENVQLGLLKSHSTFVCNTPEEIDSLKKIKSSTDTSTEIKKSLQELLLYPGTLSKRNLLVSVLNHNSTIVSKRPLVTSEIEPTCSGSILEFRSNVSSDYFIEQNDQENLNFAPNYLNRFLNERAKIDDLKGSFMDTRRYSRKVSELRCNLKKKLCKLKNNNFTSDESQVQCDFSIRSEDDTQAQAEDLYEKSSTCIISELENDFEVRKIENKDEQTSYNENDIIGEEHMKKLSQEYDKNCNTNEKYQNRKDINNYSVASTQDEENGEERDYQSDKNKLSSASNINGDSCHVIEQNHNFLDFLKEDFNKNRCFANVDNENIKQFSSGSTHSQDNCYNARRETYELSKIDDLPESKKCNISGTGENLNNQIVLRNCSNIIGKPSKQNLHDNFDNKLLVKDSGGNDISDNQQSQSKTCLYCYPILKQQSYNNIPGNRYDINNEHLEVPQEKNQNIQSFESVDEVDKNYYLTCEESTNIPEDVGKRRYSNIHQIKFENAGGNKDYEQEHNEQNLKYFGSDKNTEETFLSTSDRQNETTQYFSQPSEDEATSTSNIPPVKKTMKSIYHMKSKNNEVLYNLDTNRSSENNQKTFVSACSTITEPPKKSNFHADKCSLLRSKIPCSKNFIVKMQFGGNYSRNRTERLKKKPYPVYSKNKFPDSCPSSSSNLLDLKSLGNKSLSNDFYNDHLKRDVLEKRVSKSDKYKTDNKMETTEFLEGLFHQEIYISVLRDWLLRTAIPQFIFQHKRSFINEPVMIEYANILKKWLNAATIKDILEIMSEQLGNIFSNRLTARNRASLLKNWFELEGLTIFFNRILKYKDVEPQKCRPTKLHYKLYLKQWLESPGIKYMFNQIPKNQKLMSQYLKENNYQENIRQIKNTQKTRSGCWN